MPGGSSIALEQAVLDTARVALGREDGSAALAAADSHARRFPHGQLSEEREAIAIQALVLLHRDTDARARADRFVHTYPNSALMPAIEEAIRSAQPAGEAR
jgi:outer membrane protein assembly factor BamD (BamD/ComL family)